ncbi:ErmB/QacA family multidrug efflux protein [Paenibacillus terrae HPL-003]|uniref:ErmB/QacA family multidrug efflux protein n=1 Tax=Paenibacillus terrae (strain HPL-003) TaxID=985665 RepID=G7W303_PAETH|nr:MDR family MFS transporter [Paenibacillus terrae]AET60659.1 ErmB/QacA family multidrug efflux protein [Paenibacillus terrae HPL-003]
MKIRAVSEQWKVVITVMLGTFTVLLNNSSLNPAIPSFIRVFNTNAATASWLITIFLITMGMTMPLTGYLADRFGKKKVYLSGLALFVTGSLFGSLSWGLITVILCRGLQGVAGGMMIPLSLALIFEAFPKEERGKVTGIWGIAIMAAPMLGPTVGGIVLSLSSWQVLFLINVPTGLLGLLMGIRYLTAAHSNPSRTFDSSGFITVTLGVGFILFALGRTTTVADLIAPLHILLFLAGAVLLVLFVRMELVKEQPLLNVHIFKIPTYSLSVIVASVQAIAMFGSIFLVPMLVQNVYGFDAMMTGLVFLPSAICTGWFVTIAGKQLDRKGPKGMIGTGLIITCAATAMLGMLQMNSPLWMIFILMMLRGIGLGLSNMPATTAGLNAIPDELVAQGSAMNNVMRRLTSSLGMVVISIYFEVRKAQLLMGGYSVETGTLQAIREGFIGMSILILLTIPATFFLNTPDFLRKEGARRTSSDTPEAKASAAAPKV